MSMSGVRLREVVMAEKVASKSKSAPKETTGVTFKCNLCGESKPLQDMMILTRFFPRIVACRDCEKKMR